MDKELLLASYFSNRLSEDEEKMFNEFLESDADFKKQFDFEQNLKRAIKNKESQDLKTKLVSFEKEIVLETPPSSSKKSYRYLAIAASIVLLFGLAWMGYVDGSSSKFEDLYAANFQEYPNTVFTITRSDSNESVERQAFVAYESGDYITAIERFNQMPNNKEKSYIDFYRAHSYLNSAAYEKAKEHFKKIIAKEDEFVGESHWYLTMIAIKEEDKKSAIAELKKLTTGYDYNKEKALELLKNLD